MRLRFGGGNLLFFNYQKNCRKSVFGCQNTNDFDQSVKIIVGDGQHPIKCFWFKIGSKVPKKYGGHIKIIGFDQNEKIIIRVNG